MVSPFLYEYGDRFPVLDLVASFDSKSESSISFNLGTESDTLRFPLDGVEVSLSGGRVFNVIGWVDVHYPCVGHIKARLRVLLPSRYHECEQMRELVERMFEALGISSDETYEASFVSAERQTRIEQATNRDGYTDRIY